MTQSEKIIEQEKFSNEIKKKYPNLFLREKWNCGSDLIGINKGWFNLVIECCDKLEELRDKNPNIHFFQIKEKFARLTIYLGGIEKSQDVQLIYKNVEEICDRSLTICENCGTESNVSQKDINFWIKTLCDKCSLPSKS